MKIIFSIPDENAPGYLKRTRSILYFQEIIKSGTVSPSQIDEMVDFLAGFVTEPANKVEAVEALWDASQAQLFELFAQLGGETIDSPLAESESVNGSRAKELTRP